MKTKYLFYSLALTSAFAACSQEELINASAVENNLAERPVAGVVEFTLGEGVDSRFNYELKDGFQNGDVFGLYLMDNFKSPVQGVCGEHEDANTTYWRYQNHWWGMYELTNNINSNYPFTYGNGKWTNDAKLVEGNYFAMFPQNDKALNRRELWHSIKPQVALKAHSSKENVFQYVENQFWLGYQQIYRDATASAEGVMEMSVTMSAALIPLRIEMTGFANNDVILDKISFRSKSGKALPTLAYVEPKDFVTESTDDVVGTNCDDCKGIGLYDAAKTWTKANVQNLIKWSYPGENDRVPYGLEGADATPAYEYSFTYPEGTQVDALVRNGDVVNTYIAIPAFDTAEDWNDIEVCIYGWRVTNGSQGPIYGMLTKNNAPNASTTNYSFELKDVIGWNQEQAQETVYYRPVYVEFSDFSWQPINEAILTSSTEDMEKMVLSYLSKTVNDTQFTIKPDVNGVEIRKEFLAQLRTISAQEGRSITLTFDGTRKEAKVIFNDDETMAIDGSTTETVDRVKFSYTSNIKLVNNATQTVKDYAFTEGATIENNGTLNVNKDGVVVNVENNNIMTVNHNGSVTNLTNFAELTLKCSSSVTTLENEIGAVTTVDAAHATCTETATVGTFNNKGDHNACTTCAPATLNVVSGTLSVTTLNNDATITNNATIAVAALNNDSHVHGNRTVKAIIDNYGNINGTVTNNATINNGNAEDKSGNMNGNIINNDVINVYNTSKIEKLVNGVNGKLFVNSVDADVIPDRTSNGTIIFVGVVNKHITVGSYDKRVFRTIADMNMSDVVEDMDNTKTTYLWTAYDITFDGTADKKDDVKYEYLDEVVIEGAKVIFNGEKGDEFTFTKNPSKTHMMTKLVINKGCQLNVEDGITVKFDDITGDGEGKTHVDVVSSLKHYVYYHGGYYYKEFDGTYSHN